MIDLRPLFRDKLAENFVPEQLRLVGDQFGQQERPDGFLGVELSNHAQCFDEIIFVLGWVALFSQMLESQRAERKGHRSSRLPCRCGQQKLRRRWFRGVS